MTQSVLLNAGCGPITQLQRIPAFFRSPGWTEIRLDIDPSAQPDILASVTDLSCVASDSIDAIWSSHNVEHLYAHEVERALREFLRVLKPDGFAYLKVPDLQAIATLVAADGLDEPAYNSGMGPITPLDMIYGHGSSIAAGHLFMAHRTGFTPSTLGRALTNAGFGFGVLKRQVYLELSALAFKNDAGDLERRNRILAELEF